MTIATSGSARTSAAPGRATTPAVSVTSAPQHERRLRVERCGRPRARRPPRAPAGRGWPPGSPRRRARGARPSRPRPLGAAVESTSTPSRSEITAASSWHRHRVARAAGRGRARPRRRRPRARPARRPTTAPSTSTASAHGSEIGVGEEADHAAGRPGSRASPSTRRPRCPGPGAVSGWRPAALNISGTPFATPRPTRNRPASAAPGWPIAACAPSGTPVSSAPPAQQRDRPDAVVDRVADHAPGGHAGGEERVGERGERGAGAEVLAQVEAAPVGHRALGHHHEQAQHGEQHDAARGQREARRVLALGGRAVPDAADAASSSASSSSATRSRRSPARRRRARAQAAAKPGAGHAAERPAGVQRGHDRPPEVVLDLHAVAVHGHVHASRWTPPSTNSAERDQQRVRREHGQVDRERGTRCRRASIIRRSPGARSPGPATGKRDDDRRATCRGCTRPIALLERSKRSCTQGICATQVPMRRR